VPQPTAPPQLVEASCSKSKCFPVNAINAAFFYENAGAFKLGTEC
jgi:hypothetical protein